MDNDIHNPKQNHAFCGGAILNENWILSAGHCCKGKYEDEIHAMVGAHFDHTCHHRGVCDNNNPKRQNIIGQQIPIEKIKIHPLYEKRDYFIYNDFCLLKTRTKIPINTCKVDSIKLPERDLDITGKRCTAMGWGQTESGLPSATLQKFTTQVFFSELLNKYTSTIFRGQVVRL